MQRYASEPQLVSRTPDARPKTSSQASISQLLQARFLDSPHVFPASPASEVVQAMFVRQEPCYNRLFAVSDDQRMVTGMDTPNHELYVDSPDLIETMNQFAARSKLFFRPAGGTTLFKKPYIQVQAGFKNGQKVETPGFFGSKTKHVNLDVIYRKKVAPAIQAYRKMKKAAVLREIDSCLNRRDYLFLKKSVGDLTSALELFKKLVIYDQTTESYHAIVSPIDDYLAFIALVEVLVYNKTATSENMQAQLVKIADKSYSVQAHSRSNPFLQKQLIAVLHLANEVAHAIPSGKTIDLILLHRDNTEDAMMRSIEQGDPMFYRACDVMAATLMGNTIGADNKQQLKIYSSGGRNAAFHYAAKVLQSGNDWVTLESFAAGERETEVFGIDENELEKNLDNSWNYLMYGSLRKRHADFLSPDDNYFELYTKLRYHLKGIRDEEGIGAFSLACRNRTNSRVPPGAFMGLADGFTSERSEAIWKRLQYNQVLDREGRVLKESFLDSDYIGLRLEESVRPYAPVITRRIEEYYRRPSPHSHIQGGFNNEMRNIVGWINFLKLKMDARKLADTLSEKLPSMSSQLVHDEGWNELMKHL